MFTEPTPSKPQLTWAEQRRILRAALGVLHPAITEIRPDPNDKMTVEDHLELAIMDSIGNSYAADAIPTLFQDMSAAALGELMAVSAERGMPFS